MKVGDRNILGSIVKWFIIPWLIFGVLGGYLYDSMKTPDKNIIKPYVDLSQVNPEELFILDTKRAISEGVENKDNMPFYLKGSNDVGILLIHGFTASPFEMKALGEYLNEKGFSVYGARLPGHASSPENINKLTFMDMYEGLKYGYYVLKNTNKKVFVIGQSMGGLLAAEVAIFNKVDGLIMLSPAFKIKSNKVIFVPFLRKFVKFSKKENFEDRFADHYYNVRPVEGIYQLTKLSRHLIPLLPEMKIPVYVVQSKYDDIIDSGYTEYYFKQIGTERKTIDILDDNRVKHILTTDENPLMDNLFSKIYEWILGVM
ncbi:MAG: alpha/beta fold hydrolase [Deferribacterales bacterium]|nr:alpha/beta fold hydrolase [Deferribacterales bacterium]